MATSGLALSSFDMFHVGHLSAIRQALEAIDDLVLVVADDQLVRARRGSEPWVAATERVEVLAAFFPSLAVESTATDDGDALIGRFGVDVVFVSVPPATAVPAAVSSAVVRAVAYEMTTSRSLRANLEPEILWVPA